MWRWKIGIERGTPNPNHTERCEGCKDAREKCLATHQIEISFAAVIEHKHFAVLVRAHGARVDVEVRVNFDARCSQTAQLQQGANATGTKEKLVLNQI